MNKRLENIALSSLVAVLGVMGLWVEMPMPTVGQTSTSQQQQLEEAAQLNRQAVQLSNQGRTSQAIPLAERALAIWKQVLGQEHRHVAGGLSNLALLYQNMGRYVEAERLSQQALAIRKRLFGNEHPDVADTLVNLALLYRLQERYKEAERFSQQALTLQKRLFGDEHPDVVMSLRNLAALYSEQERYEEAEPLYQQVIKMAKRLAGEENPFVADTLSDLSAVYQSQGKYEEAERLLQQVLVMQKRLFGYENPQVASTLKNLARLHLEQGRYEETERLYKQALAMLNRSSGGENRQVVDTLKSLGILYSEKGRFGDVERLYQEILMIQKRLLKHENLDVAYSLLNLAELYQSLRKYEEAKSLYQQSLDMMKHLLGDEHPNVEIGLNNLAGLYFQQERYEDAERLYQKVLALKKRRLGEENLSVALHLNELAGLYLIQGRYKEAEPLLHKVLAIVKQLAGEEHPLIASNLQALGLLYLKQGRYEEAETFLHKALVMQKRLLGNEHLDVADNLAYLAALYYSQGDINRTVDFLTQSLEIQEYNLARNLVFGSERQKRDNIKQFSNTFNAAISLHLQIDPSNSSAARLALTTILRRKGRLLDVTSNNLQIVCQRLTSDNKALCNEYKNTLTKLANLAFKKPQDIASPKQYRQQLSTIEDKARQIEDQISRRSNQFRTETQPTTLEAIQELIPSDAALVELVQYQPFNPKAPPQKSWGVPRYAAYILHHQGNLQAIDLGQTEVIEGALIDFRNNLQDQDTPLIQLKESARKLDAKLMQPVRQLLGNTKTILLSPDAALSLIPFEALVDESERYLVENYQINYLTSGRNLLRLKDKFSSQQSPIIIADPLYGKEGEKVALTRSIDLSKFTFSRLEGTKEEANALKQLLPKSIVLTQSQATENALKQVQEPNILHIASHGFFLESSKRDNNNNEFPENFDNPLLRSGLVLAGVKLGQSAGDDGVVTALETTTLNLVGTKLVVLSACDTGVGDITTGEGVYGLRRALVIAGSESQLISLWKVSDSATKDLMVAYYGRLKKGEGRSEALRQIKLEMIKSENQKHPFFWASFIFSGESKPMQFDE